MDKHFISLLENEKSIETLFNSKNSYNVDIVKCNISRFLAAYYLNFTLIYNKRSNINKKLPNLFEWSQNDYINNDDYILIDRNFISSRLSSNISPKVVLFLLIRSNLILECVLYCDYFNDIRTRLLIRYYADILYNTELFNDTFEDILNNLFNSITNNLLLSRSLKDITVSISQQIESIIQLAVLFDKNLLNALKVKIIKEIDISFYSLSEDISDDIILPRPPIYSLPAQYGVDVVDNNEILVWNKLYFLIHSYIILLNKSNQLNYISNLIIRIINNEEDADVELNDPFDENVEDSFEFFFSIIILILRMSYRDTLTIAKRELWDGIDILEETFLNLFPLRSDETFKDVTLRVLRSGTENDIEQIIMFINFIQSNYKDTNLYVPQLSNSTINEWRQYYLSNYNHRDINDCDHQMNWIYPELLTTDNENVKKMTYLSNKWSSISLNDDKLIQICLRVNSDELFEPDKNTIFQQLSVNVSSLPIIKEQDERLASGSSKYTMSDDDCTEDSSLESIKKEIKEGRIFVNNLQANPGKIELSSRIYKKTNSNFDKIYWTSLNQRNFKKNEVKPQMNQFEFGEEEETGEKMDINEMLRKDLMEINERLNKLRGISVLDDQVIDQKVEKQVKEEDKESSSSSSETRRSKRYKNQSRARQERDRIRESQRSSTSEMYESECFIPYNNEEEARETHPSDRPKDYLHDLTVLPEPSIPQIDKLDLSQLSPPPEKLEDRKWNEIEVFSPDKNEYKLVIKNGADIPSLEIDSSSKSSYLKKKQLIEKHNERILIKEYPEWLKLLPPKDDDSGRPSTSSGRLLDLDLACRSNRSNKSARYNDQRDSGYNECNSLSSNRRHTDQDRIDSIGFSCNMTTAQINELMGICN